MIDPMGTVGIVGSVVKVLENGGKVVVRYVDKAGAVAARRAGENVEANTRQMARQIELAAAGGKPIIKHTGGHKLAGGARGLPHYQRKGSRGHTFWAAGGVAVLAFPDDAESAMDFCPRPDFLHASISAAWPLMARLGQESCGVGR
jgi:hypothetical protein